MSDHSHHTRGGGATRDIPDVGFPSQPWNQIQLDVHFVSGRHSSQSRQHQERSLGEVEGRAAVDEVPPGLQQQQQEG